MSSETLNEDESGKADKVTKEAAECTFLWAKDVSEKRRCWIFERMANSEISGNILVENMQKVNAWIRDEAVPATEPVKKSRAGLKVCE